MIVIMRGGLPLEVLQQPKTAVLKCKPITYTSWREVKRKTISTGADGHACSLAALLFKEGHSLAIVDNLRARYVIVYEICIAAFADGWHIVGLTVTMRAWVYPGARTVAIIVVAIAKSFIVVVLN